MIETIDIQVVHNSLLRLKQLRQRDVDKYITIMNNFHSCDASQDREFQRTYIGLYRMQRKKQEFYRIYFEYMEQHKRDNIKFQDIINHIYNKTNEVHPSFSSKMLATINPNMPVYDSIVLGRLSIVAPQDYYKNSAERLSKRIKIYNNIVEWYDNHLRTKNAKDVIRVFDEVFPNIQATNTKKIDLALWSMGVE